MRVTCEFTVKKVYPHLFFAILFFEGFDPHYHHSTPTKTLYELKELEQNERVVRG